MQANTLRQDVCLGTSLTLMVISRFHDTCCFHKLAYGHQVMLYNHYMLGGGGVTCMFKPNYFYVQLLKFVFLIALFAKHVICNSCFICVIWDIGW